MGRCRWCDKRGLFLVVDSNGLCDRCRPLIIEVTGRARVLQDSMRLAREGKTFGTRISRCELAIKHAERLAMFENKGIPTVEPPPSRILADYRKLRERIIREEGHGLANKAIEKASVAGTAKAKERILSSALMKLKDFIRTYQGFDGSAQVELRLRSEVHSATLKGFLDNARKAEFKGNVRKAIDQYQEALFFVRNDGIDDAAQQSGIAAIESRINELRSRS